MTGPCAGSTDGGSVHIRESAGPEPWEYDNAVGALAGSSECGSRYSSERPVPAGGTLLWLVYSGTYCSASPVCGQD